MLADIDLVFFFKNLFRHSPCFFVNINFLVDFVLADMDIGLGPSGVCLPALVSGN